MPRNHHIQDTEQDILNKSFDTTYQTTVVTPTSFDGQNMVSDVSGMVATKITESGSYTYIAIAPPGTSQASASWQVKRVYDDGAGTTTITWADGDAEFDNVATDLTSLTYS